MPRFPKRMKRGSSSQWKSMRRGRSKKSRIDWHKKRRMENNRKNRKEVFGGAFLYTFKSKCGC